MSGLKNLQVEWWQAVSIGQIFLVCSWNASNHVIGSIRKLPVWPMKQHAWRRLSKHEPLRKFISDHLASVFRASGKRAILVLNDSKSKDGRKLETLVCWVVARYEEAGIQDQSSLQVKKNPQRQLFDLTGLESDIHTVIMFYWSITFCLYNHPHFYWR